MESMNGINIGIKVEILNYSILLQKKNKNIYIHGRNDDVINIRGHRIGSEEVESTILNLSQITECCAVMLDDYLEGGKIYLFVVSKVNLDNQIEKLIISAFGSYALPKKIFYVPQIPKTRSGKMLRGLLRNILKKPKSRNYGDISTILNINTLKEVKKIIINSYD
jgi:acetyl-CoA synthetase